MFRAEPWAEAFMNVSSSSAGAEEALEYLGVFCRSARTLPGELSGRSDADRIGASISAALARSGVQTGASGETVQNVELARRFIQLMLRKHCFRYSRMILLEIEKHINRMKGIEEVIAEIAVEPDEALTALIRQKALEISGIVKKNGAHSGAVSAAAGGERDIKLTIRVIPELIGGLRLRFGGRLFDGSIKYGLKKMAEDLTTGLYSSGLEA